MSASPRQSAPVSRATAWKILLSVIVGVAAVSSIFYASMASDMQLYRMVDEVVSHQPDYEGKTLRIHGYVRGKVLNKPGTNQYKFTLESRPPRAPGTVQIDYTGIVPDTLKEGAEVVATGKLLPGLMLVANHVSAQCPSKYDPAANQKIGSSYSQKME